MSEVKEASTKTISSTSSTSERKQSEYIAWLRHRAVQDVQPASEETQRAWQLARQAAQLLRERYQVTRVRVFGSLLHPTHFHRVSDLDLAVEGLREADYWDAMADLFWLGESQDIDMADPATCRSEVWSVVEREGVEV